MHRIFALIMAGLFLAACTNPNDLDEAPVDLGNFHLGHNVVVAPNITKGPASRDASKEEWIEAMKLAIDERFGRYEGSKLYHLGISIEGYVLAIPGVPIVASPKSALILRVTAWDDAASAKLNEEPEQVTILESFSANTIFGSGLTQSKEKQMENLTRNAAKLIQNWLEREHAKNGWFGQETETTSTDGEAKKSDAEQSDTPTAKPDTTEDTDAGEETAETVLDDPEVVPPVEEEDS